MSHPFIGGFVTYRKPPYGGFMWLYTQAMVIRPIVRGYTNLSSYASTSYQENQRWLCVPYRGYAWLYVVIYCKCTENGSVPRNDSQGHPPSIMTSVTSRKYSRRWFYVVIHPNPWLYVRVPAAQHKRLCVCS